MKAESLECTSVGLRMCSYSSRIPTSPFWTIQSQHIFILLIIIMWFNSIKLSCCRGFHFCTHLMAVLMNQYLIRSFSYDQPYLIVLFYFSHSNQIIQIHSKSPTIMFSHEIGLEKYYTHNTIFTIVLDLWTITFWGLHHKHLCIFGFSCVVNLLVRSPGTALHLWNTSHYKRPPRLIETSKNEILFQ